MDNNWLQQIEGISLQALQNGSQEAQQQILQFHTSADYIPQCRFILDNSQSPYAQLTASTSLEILVTQFWNNFTPDQKLEMRNYILGYLAQHAPHLAQNAPFLEFYVVQSLTKLVCRITKLGWFDHQDHRNIIDETSSFLEASISHHIIGLRLLNALVDEMNTPTQGRTLTLHRKTAVSFRDQSLYNAFQIAITTLGRVHPNSTMSGITDDEKQNVALQALTLANNCLSFDFIGTNPEESAEDVSTVQVPSLWRPIVQDTSTMQLFFDFYMNSNPPLSGMALQTLVQLSSVRRSLFASEKERTVFLQALMSGIQVIMQSKQGLADEDNYHQFCRLLGRLKASYQLSELVKTTHFIEWLQLSGEFTVQSLQNWRYSMNSIHYLLALWGRLVAALPYLRAEATDSAQQPTILRTCVVEVVQSYIQTMLASVDTVVRSDGDIDDPLEDESSLREQMDRLPVLARLQYEITAQYMAQEFERCLTHYKQGLDYPQTSDVQFELKILEGKMTWLVHMVAAVIGAQISSEPRKAQSEVEWDGSLSKYVFHLVQLLDHRLTHTKGDGKCDNKLEMAILSFFKSFKKTFMMDSASSGPSIGSIPGGSPAHPLLSLALSSYGARGDDKEGDQGDRNIFAVMGLGDGTAIMGMIVNKICSNIKYWHKNENILEETLEVFVELVSSYSSSKTLLSLETVHFLVHNHVGTEFPFLGYDNDNKHRITFYSALSRLVFSTSEDMNNSFDAFILPNLQLLEQLNGISNLRDPAVKIAIIGILRDLRGITTSTYNKRTYNLLFDALYPESFQLFVRVAQTWYDDWTVMTALFKFMQEFVHNKGQRIYFEQSSANGILLFRETSAIVCAYGSKILEVPVQSDIYLEKYKGIRLMLNTLTMALSGNYVNFGVFNLYNDEALQVALDVSLQVCLKIPFADVMTYLKLSKAYYAFLDILFRNHLDVLSGLSSEIFIQLVKCCQEGLQSSDLSICAFCASAVDHLATYMFLNSTKEKPTIQLIRMHMSSEPDLYNQLMATLFNTLLFTPHANHWAVTRPILSLILSSDAAYIEYKSQLISTQTADSQHKLIEEFDKLTQDIQRSVETVNRDKFTQKLTLFRLAVRTFLTL